MVLNYRPFWVSTSCSRADVLRTNTFANTKYFDYNNSRFTIKNFENFKYVIFRCDASGDNFKNRTVSIYKDGNGVPLATLQFSQPDDQGRYGESYVSVEQLISYGSTELYAYAVWRETTTKLPQCKLDIYLSYITTIGSTIIQ